MFSDKSINSSNLTSLYLSLIAFEYFLVIAEIELLVDKNSLLVCAAKTLKIHSGQNFDNLSIPTSHQNRVQMIKMMMNDKEKFQAWAEELEVDIINKTIGIISFSQQWKNVLMWSHYAKHHSGYCIGLNEAKLRNTGKIEYGGKVNYPTVKKFPSIHPMMDEYESFYHKFFTKSKDWYYEEEYRIVNFIHPNKDADSSSRLLKYDADFIDEVILGIKMSESDRKEIIDICKNLGVKVYQAVEKNFEFEVDRYEIST